MTAVLRRLRGIDSAAFDRALAVALLVAGEAEVLLVRPANTGLCMLAVAGFTLPFALRRRRPLPAAVAVIASVLLMRAFASDPTDIFIPFLCAMILSYGVGAHLDGRDALVGLAIAAGGVMTVSLLGPTQVAGDYIFPPAFAFLFFLAGRAVRTRTRLTEQLHEAAALEQEAHEREALRAAADERRRIAREMHDVVAHSVSVMVVQAGGARRILDREPARAEAAAEQIERTGREALAEMRRLLGVLHPAEDHPALAPQPTMDAVGELVERARDAGIAVELRVEGKPRRLSAGLDLAAFRVVQEGLTNALKHAGGGPAEVTIRWSAAELELEIADRGPGPVGERAAGGHGLVGMRERVRLYGGELEAGRRSGGGFRVHVRLPLTSAAPAPAEGAAV